MGEPVENRTRLQRVCSACPSPEGSDSDRATAENRTRESVLGKDVPYHWATVAQERMAGIEPACPEWKSDARPIGHIRMFACSHGAVIGSRTRSRALQEIAISET